MTIGAASQLVFQTQPAGTVDGITFGLDPLAALEDIGGNIETLNSSSTVTLAIDTQPGTGTLTCDNNTLTLAAGEADFTNCQITGTVGAYTIVANDAGDSLSATSAPITLTIGAASQLVLLGQPTGAVDGVTFGSDPLIALEDVGGNIETLNSSSTVTLAINTQPGTGTLTCDNNALTVAAGEADFANCVITGTVGDYTLKATGAGVSSAISTAITLTPGAPSQLVITSAPISESTSASPSSGPLTVVLEDLGGNETTDLSDVSVALSSTSIGGSFASSPSGADVSTVEIDAGQEGVTFYYGDTAAGAPTITVEASGLPVATQIETIVPGAAASVAIVSGSVSVAVYSSFIVQTQIVDAFGNPVADSGVEVSISSNPAVELSGSTTLLSGADGSVTFDNLAFQSTGAYILSASAPSLGLGLSSSVPAAVKTIATAPAAPGAPVAASSTPSLLESVVISWVAPNDGGSSITSYTVTPYDETLGVAGAPESISGDVTSTTITDLTPGHAFDFSVIATNALGSGSSSPASNSVEPILVLPVVSVTASSASETGTASASVGSSSSPGSITVSATGLGTVSVSRFATPPIPNAPSNLTYFDVAVAPGSNFTTVTFQICGLVAGGEIQWQDPLNQTFIAASDQSAAGQASACATVTVTQTSTPTISELYGSIFAAPLDDQNVATPSYAVTIVVSHVGSSEFGSPVTYRATLTPSASVINSGTVEFTVGTRILCSATVTNDVATCTSSNAPRAGVLVVVATFWGTSVYPPTRANGRVVISPEIVKIVVKKSASGTPRLTVLVEAQRPGTHLPIGWLAVSEGGKLVNVALRHGAATLNLRGTVVNLKYHGGRDFQTKQIVWRV